MNNSNSQTNQSAITPSPQNSLPDKSASGQPASTESSASVPTTVVAPTDAPVSTDCPQPQQAAKVSDTAVSPNVERKLTKAQRDRAKKWNNDNRRTFRSDAEVDALIGAECDTTGCTETDAIKRLILRGAGKDRVVLQTAAAPEHLAKVMVMANELARSVRSVRSRINAPVMDTGDVELTALLKEWRRTAQELPPQLAALTSEIHAVVRTLTQLTPENVRLISDYQKGLQQKLAKSRQELAAAEKEEVKNALTKELGRTAALIQVLTSLGIFQPTPPCPPPK